MDEAILKQVYKLYNATPSEDSVMPMTIDALGNTSVATVPTLYDLMAQRKIENHTLDAGATLVFASVGAGVNMNAVAYKIPE